MLHVLYEDHHLLVVNKPAPLLTQAPPGIPSLEAAVKDYIRVKFAKPAGVYLGVPHRLDRPVSGAICFCRNSKAATRVHQQFAERTVGKTYWAAVAGVVEPPAGTWQDWVRKVKDEARTERVAEGDLGAKLAALDYKVLRAAAGGCVIAFSPTTGRMHQLRAQAAWRGHPVVGDAQYGSEVPFGPPAELPRDRAIALHARRLEITHPFTGVRLAVEADVPAYWAGIIGSTGGA